MQHQPELLKYTQITYTIVYMFSLQDDDMVTEEVYLIYISIHCVLDEEHSLLRVYGWKV